jgi:hypothetical protein
LLEFEIKKETKKEKKEKRKRQKDEKPIEPVKTEQKNRTKIFKKDPIPRKPVTHVHGQRPNSVSHACAR